MRRDNPWVRKQWLELHPWSFLRDVGLSPRAGRVALALWIAYALAALALHPQQWEAIALWTAVGFYCVNYIVKRLGGRPALLRAGIYVTAESPFQGRLFGDVACVAGFLWCVGAVARVWG